MISHFSKIQQANMVCQDHLGAIKNVIHLIESGLSCEI